MVAFTFEGTLVILAWERGSRKITFMPKLNSYLASGYIAVKYELVE